MHRKLLFLLCLLLLFASPAIAGTKQQAGKPDAKASQAVPPAAEQAGAKQLSGMSIVGNDEAPKSLYIVPWKSSEVGVETSLNGMLSERPEPVDRDVFRRQLDFYELSIRK